MKAGPAIATGFGLAAALGVALIGGCQRAAPPTNRVSAYFPAGDLAHGKTLEATCLACHGAAAPALGTPPFHAPKLRYQRPSVVFYALQDYRAGRRKSEFMGPLAATMSDQDMRDLALAVTDRTAKSRIPKLEKLADDAGHRLNEKVCGMCHGESGLGELDGYPVLGGQYPDYLEHALAAYRSGDRTNPIMQRFARELTPDEVKLMAGYFADRTALEPAQVAGQ